MPSPIVAVGVDLGGTWIRLEAVDAQGRKIRSLKAPAPALTQLPNFLNKRFRTWNVRLPRLIVASRGVWTGSERAHLKQALKRLANHVTVMSDVEAAWMVAFGRNGQGVMVISGTGSIAYGRDADGCSRRTGGWGPLLGDEGSGFWIAKTWLKRTRENDTGTDILKLVRSPQQAVRRVAALVPKILRLEQHGNRSAKAVVAEAQHHLAQLVIDTTRHLHFKQDVPVSWGGRLLSNPRFRAGFLAALRRAKKQPGRRFQLIRPGGDPALTIAKLFKTSS